MAESHSAGAPRNPFMIYRALNNLAEAEVDVFEDMSALNVLSKPVAGDKHVYPSRQHPRCNDRRTSWEVWVMYDTLIWCESWVVRRVNEQYQQNPVQAGEDKNRPSLFVYPLPLRVHPLNP